MAAALRILGVLVVVLLVGPRPASATAPPDPRPLDSSTWMPDVAERVADLRDRARQAQDEAETQREADARDGQWWRAVVAAVPPERAR